ncbi:hypothetical protein ACNKHK_13410 [Shigella flexneri]
MWENGKHFIIRNIKTANITAQFQQESGHPKRDGRHIVMENDNFVIDRSDGEQRRYAHWSWSSKVDIYPFHKTLKAK